MTNMAELAQQKKPLNHAVVYVAPAVDMELADDMQGFPRHLGRLLLFRCRSLLLCLNLIFNGNDT